MARLRSKMEVLVLGCGPSSSVPSLRCLLSSSCAVCHEAHCNPLSKNRRLNPSILIRAQQQGTTSTSQYHNILIDCGKTFRESALRIWPQQDVEAIDAVVLTHGHADACLGMDDLREVQRFVTSTDPTTHEVIKTVTDKLVVHCSEPTFGEIREKFEYLIEKPVAAPIATEDGSNGDAAPSPSPTPPPAPFRWIAKLGFQLFTPFKPFHVCGVAITPFPVWHGIDYI